MIRLLVQNSENKSIFDISELVSNVQWTTYIEDQPGKLTFNFANDPNFTISEGSIIDFKVNGQGIFYGFVFKVARDANNLIAVTAYDQLRYLKNKDTYVFNNQTASQIFSKICKEFNLNHKIITPTDYQIAPRIHDNKNLYEVIQFGIDETLVHTGEWYIISDRYGTIEFTSLNRLKTDLFIGDNSLLLNYQYESSIDEDSYNQIKLIKENKGSQKREIYIVKDSANINKWGLLQYFEKMDENANEAQIKERAEKLLKIKNRTTRKLKLQCLGDLRLFAGCGVMVGISDLERNLQGYYIILNCVHTFANNAHLMELYLQEGV